MRNIYTIITGICLILLCTACKQFTVDIDEYLSYWSAAVIARDYSIDSHTRQMLPVYCVCRPPTM